jgi:signal transduction histidine kinase
MTIHAIRPTVPPPHEQEPEEQTHERSATGEFAARLMQSVSTSILLVHADDMARPALADALMRRGFAVHEARTAVEAARMMAEDPCDMILCDAELPDARATEVVRRWKRSDPSRPVLVVCRAGDEEQRMDALDVGADDVMDGAISLREMIGRIEAHDRMVRATAALQQALRQADHLRLYAAEAAALLAHDLNNGLCVAIANADFVSSVPEVNTDPEVEDAVSTVTRTLRRMSILVRNFVDIARSDDGALRTSPVPTSVGDLLRTAAAVHHPRGRGKIEIQVAPGLEASIDPTLIERVVHNLLINAVRYVDDGGRVRLAARREPSPYGGGGRIPDDLVITVSNTGPRIPDHLRPTLFEKYVKGSDGKAQTGMGLYFCRLACEAHGGSVGLVSDRDFPTCFEIRIPAR